MAALLHKQVFYRICILRRQETPLIPTCDVRTLVNRFTHPLTYPPTYPPLQANHSFSSNVEIRSDEDGTVNMIANKQVCA